MSFAGKIPKVVYIGSIFGTTVGFTLLAKEYLGGSTYIHKENTLKNKVVIITGASSGIGEATALECAKSRAKVIMACRNMKKCEKARARIIRRSKFSDVHCRTCDLSSQQSIHEFAANVKATEEDVYALVNNAAVMRCPKFLTKEGIEKQFGTNHIGHFLLTHLLLDKLKSSVPSRVITVTCSAHTKGNINFNDLNSAQFYDPAAAYHQSKLANVLFTKSLAKRIEESGVKTYAVDPGITSTKITRHMDYYSNIITGVILWPLMWLLSNSPRQGAQTIMYALMDPDLEKRNGAYLSNLHIKECSEEAQNVETAERLWKISKVWAKIK